MFNVKKKKEVKQQTKQKRQERLSDLELKLLGQAACYFFSRKKYQASHYTRHMHAWRTAHGMQTTQTWIIKHLKPVPEQGTRVVASRTVFNEIHMGNSHQDLKNQRMKK